MPSKVFLLFIIGTVTCISADDSAGSVAISQRISSRLNWHHSTEHLLECSRMKDFETNLIIDSDAGGDDAVAILLALAVPEKVNVVALTCTYGNTNLTNVEKNVLKTLAVANRNDIPVYSGAVKPFFRDYAATDYFGKDGFGDFTLTKKIGSSIDRSTHAALAMVNLVKQCPGQISILIMGPTTNVALAASLDPTFSRNVKRFYVMGSKPYAPSQFEFNFSHDPESNAAFLNSEAQTPKLMVTGHVAANNKISKEWRTDVFGKIKNERVEFLNNAESKVLREHDMWQAADSITLATAIWPELVTKSAEARMISGNCSENPGAVKLVDYGKNHVEIVEEFDLEGFKAKLLEHFA